MGYKRVREVGEALQSGMDAVRSAPQKADELKNEMINKILQVDDGVQSFVRTKALGLMDDGSYLPEGQKLGTLREILGGTVFAQRPGGPTNTAYQMEDTRAGVGATLAARGLQAGGVTAAGAGLMNLSQMVFGGEADRQESGQIPLY